MGVANAIFEGMRADRTADFARAINQGSWGFEHRERLEAWLWWGWNLNGRGGLGFPGVMIGRR